MTIKKVFEDFRYQFIELDKNGNQKAYTIEDVEQFLASALIATLEELPTGLFDSTFYKQKLIAEIESEMGGGS